MDDVIDEIQEKNNYYPKTLIIKFSKIELI